MSDEMNKTNEPRIFKVYDSISRSWKVIPISEIVEGDIISIPEEFPNSIFAVLKNAYKNNDDLWTIDCDDYVKTE